MNVLFLVQVAKFEDKDKEEEGMETSEGKRIS